MDSKSFRNLDRVPGGRRSRKLADEVGWGVRIAWLKNRKQKRMALASFPRSGNTWFRLFLESATDRPTGNARRGPDGLSDPVEVLVRSGRHDAMEDNPADVAIKTHALDSYRYTHAIHLVRSPFDVLDSFYDWKRSSGWQWRHGEVAWEPFVKLIAHKWRDHTRHWLDARCTTYRIRYEDCRRDPVTNFADLLGWMGIDIPRSLLAQAVEATAFEKLKKTQIGSSAVATTSSVGAR